MAREQASARVGSANSGRAHNCHGAGLDLFKLRRKRPERMSAGSKPFISSADVRQSAAPPAAIGQDMQAASTTSWLGTKKDSKANSRSPVVWLEEPNALGSSRVADGVSINGVNVSDQRLEGGPRDTQTGWERARIQARP